MKHTLPFLLIFIFITTLSCSYKNDGRIRINIASALKHKHSINELCTEVRVFPFNLSAQPNFVISPKPVISVSKRKVFILDSTATRIGIFDASGTLLKVLDAQEKIIDFFVYEGRVIDILTHRGVVEFSLLSENIINWGENGGIANEYKAIGRRGENYIHLIGTLGDCLVDKSIILSSNKHFQGCVNPVAIAGDVNGNRFFESGDSLFFNYSTSGMVVLYTGDDFIYPIIEWDFGRNKGEKISPLFTNAQKMDMVFYFCIYYRGEEYLLIYDQCKEQYIVIDKTREGMRVPLGVISDGVNYVVCDVDTANKYLNSNLTDTSGKMVLLEYSLIFR